jgi:predicted O-methyltransferase YrrM
MVFTRPFEGGALVREAAIDPLSATLAYIEGFLPEDEPLRNARQRAEEVGAAPIDPAGGAALRFLAAVLNARTVVEIGSGCGVSGIWLLRGMRPDGILTSVDIEPDNQRLAREAYAEAGFGTSRARMIAGRALDVLPRLSDGAYDMVFCDAHEHDYQDTLDGTLRLLRPGGLLVFGNALHGDPVPVRDDERLVPLLLPVGDGLLCALKRD